MKSHQLVYLAVCFIMIQGGYSKARKRTTSCVIPKKIQGNWRAPDFETEKGKLRLMIDIGPAIAKMQQILGEDSTDIEFDCTAGSAEDGFFLTKSKVPEGYDSLVGGLKAVSEVEPFTCFKFELIDSFLKVNLYSFKKKPESQDANDVCSGKDSKKFSTIGFSPADQFNDNDE